MPGVGEGWEVEHAYREWSDWTWFKPRGGKVLKLAILSQAPVWYAGHFVRKRMCPCAGEGCKICAEGIGIQIRYVFGAVSVETRMVGLIEVGKTLGLLIRDWCGRRGALRGMVLAFTKQTHAKQSRTEVEYCDEVEPAWLESVSCPDVRKALETTWAKAGLSESELPRPGGNGSSEAKQERVRFQPPLRASR